MSRQRPALEQAFDLIKRERIQAIMVGISALMLEHRDAIVQFAAREKLPVVYGRHDYVLAGGLASYSTDLQFPWLRGADYVHRILNGAKPANLPVELVSNTRMSVNLKTARALGIKVSTSLRQRADEVIE